MAQESHPFGRTALAIGVGLVALVALVTIVVGPRTGGRGGSMGSGGAPVEREPLVLEGSPTFVGRDACAECHADAMERFAGSHHDLAMDVATEATVLGDFDGARAKHFDSTAEFVRDGDAFVARIDEGDGAATAYEVTHVFGVTPLQQYLVPTERGKLQTLPFAWDTRPRDEGGQRWFHMYPDEPIPPGDELHWLGPMQNWNGMCAECHSTNLVRGYDVERDVFETTWSEIDVSCEACHGPASHHVARARHDETDGGGLVVTLRDENGGGWLIRDGDTTASRTRPRSSRAQIENCARCHSRRSPLNDAYAYGAPFEDTHRLARLDDGLYFADGQIRDEVYVYGSFLQSRMYHAGVTCTDCHDPHSLRLRLDGNALCTQCHARDVYDVPDHLRHERDTPASMCVSCHMPERTYMVVDPRRDHSMRVPRPDLAATTGAPSACMDCHADEGEAWAARAIEEWFGPEREARWGPVIAAARRGDPGTAPKLIDLAMDGERPGIVRATAFDLLADRPGPAMLAAVDRGLADDEPIVRAAALDALDGVPWDERIPRAAPRLNDDVRLVRIAAARALLGAPAEAIAGAVRARFELAFDELVTAERANADRPGARENLGNAYAFRGDAASAIAAYEGALAIDPDWVPAAVNLADLHRATGRDDLAEPILRTMIERVPDAAAAHHALGLLLVRRGALAEALPFLDSSSRLSPDAPRYALVHALALDGLGDRARALDALERAASRIPYDADILLTLVDWYRAAGRRDDARRCADRLVEMAPGDARFRELRESLR